MDGLVIWASKSSATGLTSLGLKTWNGGPTDTWWHLEACTEVKQSREGTESVGSTMKNIDSFAI